MAKTLTDLVLADPTANEKTSKTVIAELESSWMTDWKRWQGEEARALAERWMNSHAYIQGATDRYYMPHPIIVFKHEDKIGGLWSGGAIMLTIVSDSIQEVSLWIKREDAKFFGYIKD